MVPTLQLQTVSKRFGTLRALDRVSLTVSDDEVLGLLGPPGAGKTTLLRIIAGDLQPTSGRRVALAPEAPLLTIDDPPVHLHRPRGLPAVIATASASLAHRLCDRVILLDGGRLRADRPAADLAPLLEQEYYRIRIKGEVNPLRAAAWFDGLNHQAAGGETVLTGPVPDQTALHGLLTRIRDLGLPLLEVVRVEPDLSSLYT